MNHKVYFFITVCLAVSGSVSRSQSDPDQRIPSLQVKDEDGSISGVRLNELKINITVLGNLATTTYDMLFYNSASRILEGELEFPLSEGQTISRFAMDVNGKLREGVPVEKNKGQQVFEMIERRKIDPGLLELVQGNSFRTRVYPLPAEGYKHLVVAVDQELPENEEGFLFDLPLYFKLKVRNFSLHTEVFKQALHPVMKSSDFKGFTFDSWNENYIADASYQDILLDHRLSFLIPFKAQEQKVITGKGRRTPENYFLVKVSPQISKQTRKLPASIAVIWDVSASGARRQHDRELGLLKKYLHEAGDIRTDLYLLASETERAGSYQVTGGNSVDLEKKIHSLFYDGGTQLSSIPFSEMKTEEILLFTDGMGTFGNQEITSSHIPVRVINSGPEADHSLLKYIAASSGGTYINLLSLNDDEARNMLINQPFQFISAQYTDGISEVYPSIPVPVNGSFTCTGKINADKAKITLNFGFGKKVVYSETVEIKGNRIIEEGLTEKIWAQKKLAELDMMHDKNKDEISRIGKEFNIVTRNTSLIVLESLQDYIQYEIEPPEELQTEYNRLLKENRYKALQKEKDNIENAVRIYHEKINWWNTRYPIEEPKEPHTRPVRRHQQGRSQGQSRIERDYDNQPEGGRDAIPSREYSSQLKEVTGTVYDANDGSPLVGVNVVLRGTATGAVTDIDGNFSMNVPENGILDFQYIGFQATSIDLTGTIHVEIGLAQEILQLQELVVTGYGTSRRRRSDNDRITEEVQLDITNNESIFGSSADMDASEEIRPGKGAIYVKPWDPKAPYLEQLKKVSRNELYPAYLGLKKEYEAVPSFYTDVSDLFYKKGMVKEAVRILSNLSEMRLQNHEMLRVLGHRLEQMGELKAAIEVFRKITEIRAEEPQSYRDLALVLAKDRQYQKAVDLLYNTLKKSWNGRFANIEAILAQEMNAVIAESGDMVNTAGIDSRLLNNLPVDVRVVLNWDADNTDMDLWVTGPDGEKCFYEHKLTNKGGRISDDFTTGYGPEEYMIKKADKGTYRVEVNYYGSTQQHIAGPVTLYLQLFTDYGRSGQQCKEVTLQLKTNKEVVEVADLEF